jgi:hypothetical protein
LLGFARRAKGHPPLAQRTAAAGHQPKPKRVPPAMRNALQLQQAPAGTNRAHTWVSRICNCSTKVAASEAFAHLKTWPAGGPVRIEEVGQISQRESGNRKQDVRLTERHHAQPLKLASHRQGCLVAGPNTKGTLTASAKTMHTRSEFEQEEASLTPHQAEPRVTEQGINWFVRQNVWVVAFAS